MGSWRKSASPSSPADGGSVSANVSDASVRTGAKAPEAVNTAMTREQALETLDLGARVVIPGLVDPHTHAVWAGDRLRDFEARASKVSYEEILRAGL